MPGPSDRRAWIAAAVPFLASLYFWQRYHSTGYLAFSALALAAFTALFLLWDKLPAAKLGWIALIAAATGLSALGMWQFLNLADPGDIDQASYTCWLWALEHGTGESTFSDFNIIGAHSNYALFLWIPLHWAAGEIGIKAGKIACLVAAVLLIALRHRGPKEEAPWLALAVLLSPPIASQFFFGFQSEFMAAPFLVLALQAWRDERLGMFLACTAFIAINKEIYTLPIMGLLGAGVLERRGWKWIVYPSALCCALMALWWFGIGPLFYREGVNHFNSGIPSHPMEALARVFAPSSLLYFGWFALPFLPALGAAPLRYLIVPVPTAVFYCLFDPNFREMWRHYSYPLAILCAAGWMLMPAVGRRPPARILLACAATAVLCFPMWRTVFSIPSGQGEKRRAVAEIRRLVPQEASVAVNGGFTTWFAARKDVMAWEYKVKPLEAFDYVILDEAFIPASNRGAEELAADLAALSGSPAWEKPYSAEGVHLFRKRPGGAPAP